MVIYIRHTHALGATIFERQESLEEVEFNVPLLVRALKEMNTKDDVVIEVK